LFEWCVQRIHTVATPQTPFSCSVGECDVRYEPTTTVGLSSARNLGIQLARHDIIVFTDDDVRVTRRGSERLSARSSKQSAERS
jgi:uncharacterized protein (UPF0264 family)